MSELEKHPYFQLECFTPLSKVELEATYCTRYGPDLGEQAKHYDAQEEEKEAACHDLSWESSEKGESTYTLSSLSISSSENESSDDGEDRGDIQQL